MKIAPQYEFNNKLKGTYKKAHFLIWMTIIFSVISGFLLYLVMGNSQLLKTELMDAAISCIPPIAFLVANKICWRKPDAKYPYGYHRAVSIAFLISATALLGMGTLLMFEAIAKLLEGGLIVIPTITIGDFKIWQGWLIIVLLAAIGTISTFLSLSKMPLAHELHDKILYTEAEMNKAGWMSALAAIIGIIGIRLNAGWADPLAALLISFDIFYDGFKQFKMAMAALADRSAVTLEGKDDPIIEKIKNHIASKDWVEHVEIRLREHGHLLAGSAFIKVSSAEDLHEKIKETHKEIKKFDWRVKDFYIIPV